MLSQRRELPVSSFGDNVASSLQDGHECLPCHGLFRLPFVFVAVGRPEQEVIAPSFFGIGRPRVLFQRRPADHLCFLLPTVNNPSSPSTVGRVTVVLP